MQLKKIASFIDRRKKRFELKRKINSAQQYTMCDKEAQTSLVKIAENVVRRNTTGDIVECGVCSGGTAAIIGAVISPTNKQMWLYDSFQGMPETTAIDGEDAKRWIGKCKASAASVKEALTKVGFPLQRAHIREGWFQDTFKLPRPQQVSILHIDADWYNSVQICLDTYYDLVTEGGYIVLDDFGYWEGCREAFYDFCRKRDLKPLIERAGPQQAFWVKGKTNNRSMP